MDVDRKTALQVTASLAMVLLFIVGLVVLSTTFGLSETVDSSDERGQLNGTVEGELANISSEDGTVTARFEGNFENGYEARLDGEIEGTEQNGTLTGEFDGTISGPIDGNATGQIDGSIDEESQTFEGQFNGTAEGKTATTLSPTGGLALLALLAVFLLVAPVVGYLIERYGPDDPDA